MQIKNRIFRTKKVSFRLIGLTFCALALMVSCDKCSDDPEEVLVGNWKKVSDFEGKARADAVGFTIIDTAYIGTGYDGEDRLNDFWKYNPATDQWTQKASLPDTARNGAIGFGTNSKGYIGTGYNGKDRLKGFYEYDPVANKWTRKADFAGTARYGAVAFSINNIGYVGCGYDGYTLKDFWKYDPAGDNWVQVASIGGSKRRDATAFVIENKAYVVTGVNNGSYVTDFYCYDPSNDSWKELREIADINQDESYDDKYAMKGINGVGFTINGKGYLATAGQSTVSSSVWEYNPVTDLWVQKANFEGTARYEAVAFTVSGRGFLVSGRNSSYYFDDIWEFFPDAVNNEYD